MAEQVLVSIIMGSKSDLPIMQEAATILKQFNVSYEIDIVSAHRTPKKMFDFSATAASKGKKIIIAGAGGAAHLPGMVASMTTLPVIGVPIKSHNSIQGIDSLLSIVQMPGGVPVATMAINGAKNAGILAVKILSAFDEELAKKVQQFMDTMREKVLESANDL